MEKHFPEQLNAFKAFNSGEGLCLNLPGGFGKSLVFQMAPLAHAKLWKLKYGLTANPLFIVISPLVSLMEDQVTFRPNLGIRAESMGGDNFANIVYSSSESLLGNGYGRNMLSSDKIC